LETIDTLIIGAGSAGLTTAYNRAKASHLLVIEQDKHYVGGISRTVSYKGLIHGRWSCRYLGACPAFPVRTFRASSQTVAGSLHRDLYHCRGAIWKARLLA
jgi:monoamine oxidase